MAEPWDSLRALFPDNEQGLIGADDMRSQVDALETQDGLNVKSAELESDMDPILLSKNVTYWKGAWVNGDTYEPGDMTFDTGWLMVANVTTIERPAPVATGEKETSYESTPPWVTEEEDAVVHTGMDITFSKNGWVYEVAVYIPELTGDTHYKFWLTEDPDGANPILTQMPEPILTANSWSTLALGSRLVRAGAKFRLVVDAYNSGTSTPVTGGWTFNGNSNAGAPTCPSGWNRNNGGNILRICQFDLDLVDRTAELLGMIAGTTLTIIETADPTNSQTFTVLADPVDAGDHITFSTTLTNSTGSLNAATVCTMNADVPVPLATQYVENINYYPTANQPDFATLAGYKTFNGVPVVGQEDNAYGIVFNFQEANVSEDWDIMASSDTGSAGGNITITYDYIKTTDFVVPSDTYSEVERLTTADRDSGTYELKFSLTWTYSNINNSAWLQWTIDGGTTWHEYSDETKDPTNKNPSYYSFPFEHTGGPMEVIVQCKKGGAGDTMVIDYMDIILERKP